MKLPHFVEIICYVKWLFWVFAKVGKGGAKAGLRVMLKYFEIDESFICCSLFCYYIKQIDSILPCFCSVINCRRRQNVVRTSVTHLAITSCATFWFLPHFDVICDLLLNRRTATWSLFVNLMEPQTYHFWILKGHSTINSASEYEPDILNTFFATRA